VRPEEHRQEPIRNRVMLALAYDAALRREELCSLRTDDFDPAHRTLRVRAETTKNRLERVVPYSASTGAASGLSRPPLEDQPVAWAAVAVGVPS
jgi:integrase